TRSRDVLPDPLGPSTAMNSPRATLRSSSRHNMRSPNPSVADSSATAGASFRGPSPSSPVRARAGSAVRVSRETAPCLPGATVLSPPGDPELRLRGGEGFCPPPGASNCCVLPADRSGLFSPVSPADGFELLPVSPGDGFELLPPVLPVDGFELLPVLPADGSEPVPVTPVGDCERWPAASAAGGCEPLPVSGCDPLPVASAPWPVAVLSAGRAVSAPDGVPRPCADAV